MSCHRCRAIENIVMEAADVSFSKLNDMCVAKAETGVGSIPFLDDEAIKVGLGSYQLPASRGDCIASVPRSVGRTLPLR